MLKLNQAIEIYLCREWIDFRKGINGLSVLVQDELKQSPLSGHLFVFTNKRRNKIKILYWDSNGFCLWQKQLEKDKFHWPKHLSKEKEIELTHQELRWLLEGYNLRYLRPHGELKYKKVG